MSRSELPSLGDWQSKAELYERQKIQLAQVLKAARKAPFYHSKLSGKNVKVANWAEIPFTSKEDLRDAYPFGLLAVEISELATYHESSGTTGAPTPSYLTERDWDDIASRFARSAVDMTPKDIVLVKTPYSMLTTAHQMHRAARFKGALVVPADNRSWLMPFSKVVRLLHDLGVTVAWWIPTNALLTAAAARLMGYDPSRDFAKLRAFVVAGEAMSPARRARIGAIWGGTQVVQDYGSTETGSIAGECAQGRLHIWADRLFCEVLDPETGRTAQEGVGQLVVTPLYRQAMPLLRYRLEDTVEITYDDCPCGWRLPAIRVLGRSASRIEIGGKGVFPVQIEEAVYSLPSEYGVLFWRARYDIDSVDVEIETEPGQESNASNALRDILHEQLGIVSTITAVAPGTIVPAATLTNTKTTLKPRYLFAANEAWPTDYLW